MDDPSCGHGKPGVLGWDIAGIQILTEGPACSVTNPEISSDPVTRKGHRDPPASELPVDGRRVSDVAEEAAAAVLIAGVQEVLALQNADITVPQSR